MMVGHTGASRPAVLMGQLDGVRWQAAGDASSHSICVIAQPNPRAFMPRPADFPVYGDCPAKHRIDELVRLLSPSLFNTQYIDARAAARLLAASLKTYQAAIANPRWQTSEVLRRVRAQIDGPNHFNLVCAALFDLLCNAEYIHGRLANRAWIYCHRDRHVPDSPAYAYFSFLKQCPTCCQDIGLERRLEGAQHKPSSHHIGEITTTITALFLTLLAKAGPRPLSVGVIAKQSHDVDALAWRDDLLVLFEIKASPLVTYPIRVRLEEPYTQPGDDGPEEIEQHKLIDVEYRSHDLALYLANTGVDLPLGRPTDAKWPYPQLTDHMRDPERLLDYIEAWSEVFLGYSIPKTQREGRDTVLGYLANGWGDEIDSNKTKAGLGRTDDIKKGTYQLLKFGAYYRDGSPQLAVRGALTANLDPVFMYQDYMAKLMDARWAPANRFRDSTVSPDVKEIFDKDLYHIYDSLIAFNRPVINDQKLQGCFDFGLAELALEQGRFNELFESWDIDEP